MQIELPPALERILLEVMEQGNYPDSLTAISAALGAWRNEQTRLDDWWTNLTPAEQCALNESLENDEGPLVEATPEYFESLRTMVREKAGQRLTA